MLAGPRIDEKKSNLLDVGTTCVCFGKLSGVFPVISSLKMLGFCTKRKTVRQCAEHLGHTPLAVRFYKPVQAPFIKLKLGVSY